MFDLRLHHVGCAVASIETGLKPYRDALGFSRISEIITVASQNVRVCFVETAPGVFMELVEPISEDAPVSGFLKRRQYFYHVCYSTPDVVATVEHLETKGFRRLSIFDSEAFNGTPCAFLLSPELALVELCTAGAFTLLGEGT
ncbi:hypothetical protein GC176_08800 [bacterium]|nr:hypothetical protein [bacterium]